MFARLRPRRTSSTRLVSSSSPQKMVVLNPNRDNVAAYPVKPTIAAVEIRRSDIPYANANETRPDPGVHID